MKKIDSQYMQFAKQVARKAGKMILKNFSMGMKKSWKGDNTPLTVTDVAVNTLLLRSVRKAYPTHEILAEEGSHHPGKADFVWVCDPIDGTVPFSHGIPTCVFSLALVYKGKPILGVVFDPFQERMFTAELHKGAYLNGKRIRVSKNGKIEKALIGVLHWNAAKYDLRPLIDALDRKNAILMSVWSITYMGALVANGEFSATIFQGHKSHDTAALKVIVEEAGGRVTSLYGKEQRYDQDIVGHIISNQALHPTLERLCRQLVKEKR